ncbi:polyhydroxyalkanoate granule-associated phasin [Plasticicumulans acidivorans]|uniref:Uncharacterized protein n=1 Tax=Plasticicumulans acidivorans TaxID=886464 RepID=A0A317MYM2_9GAMM|nr:polyhydroxyalkanoate granule-associated phasin [Plasticicumulans acidivorans]PWV64725.1 hypothetical protein C7443_102378 [Plasticicumulans acidivorans]
MAVDSFGDYHQLYSRLLALWSAVPTVVAIRVERMLTAGPLPSRRDQREFERMGMEKLDAFHESWLALMAQYHQECLRLALRPWWWLGPQPHAVTAAGEDISHALFTIVDHALAPIERRASANARRLSKTLVSV